MAVHEFYVAVCDFENKAATIFFSSKEERGNINGGT